MDNFTNQNFLKELKVMNIEWIRYFAVLAELKSFSKSAQHLNITQQALSKAISGIEDQLGLRLIERNGRSNNLTDAGYLFLEKSKPILQIIYDVNNFFTDYKSSTPKGALTIGWSNFWGVYVLPKIIYDFMQNFPEVYPKVFMMAHENIELKVLNGQVEIGLLIRQPERKELDFIQGPSVPYVIVGKPQPKKEWHELEYIVPGYIYGTNKGSDFWDDEKYPRNIIAQIDSLQTTLALCELGKGNIFVPEIVVKDKIENETLSITAECPFELSHELFIIWNKNIYQTIAVKEFIRKIKTNITAYLKADFPQGV